MKFGLMIAFLLVGQMSFAQTTAEKKNKEEMLARADLLISTVKETREALKAEDPVLACEKINILFAKYPDHIKGIGGSMDLIKGKTQKAATDSVLHLMYIHQQSLICKQGDDCEHLNLKMVDRKMKEINKTLTSQRKLIKKGDTNFNNSYRYEYSF